MFRKICLRNRRFFSGFLISAFLLSTVIPLALANPAPVAADPGTMEWTPIDTPDLDPNKISNIYSPIVVVGEAGSEIVKLVIGNNGYHMYAIVSEGVLGPPFASSKVRLYSSGDGGVSWGGGIYGYLTEDMLGISSPTVVVWDIAIAPDDSNIIIAAVSRVGSLTTYEVWISTDGGVNWDNTNWSGAPGVTTSEYISCMDVSIDYGSRDILVGTRDGGNVVADVNNLWTMKIPGFGGWLNQGTATGSSNPFDGDVIDARFSTTYNGDSTIVVLASFVNGSASQTNGGTYCFTGIHDIAQNTTDWQTAGEMVEVKNPDSSPMLEVITNLIPCQDQKFLSKTRLRGNVGAVREPPVVAGGNLSRQNGSPPHPPSKDFRITTPRPGLPSPRRCEESVLADDAAIWLHGTRYKPRLLRLRSQ